MFKAVRAWMLATPDLNIICHLLRCFLFLCSYLSFPFLLPSFPLLVQDSFLQTTGLYSVSSVTVMFFIGRIQELCYVTKITKQVICLPLSLYAAIRTLVSTQHFWLGSWFSSVLRAQHVTIYHWSFFRYLVRSVVSNSYWQCQKQPHLWLHQKACCILLFKMAKFYVCQNQYTFRGKH